MFEQRRVLAPTQQVACRSPDERALMTFAGQQSEQGRAMVLRTLCHQDQLRHEARFTAFVGQQLGRQCGLEREESVEQMQAVKEASRPKPQE